MSTSSTPRWVVTGGTGFFGTRLAHWLLAEHEVHPVLVDPAPLDDPDLEGRVEVIRADVRDAAAMRRAVAGADVVVHAAAALPREPVADIRAVTVEGTRNVARASLDAGVRRVVYIGSTAVYGVPKVFPVPETEPLDPLGPYAVAKVRAEEILRESRRAGLHASIIRPKSFIGTGRLGVFQILFDWVDAGKRLPVLGSGENRYQLLEVTDLAEAVWRITESDAEATEYNVGATRFGTVNADLTALNRHAGKGGGLRHVPTGAAKQALRVLHRLHLSPLYPWVYETCDHDSAVDTRRIETALGWAPRFSNAEMLCATYDWYRAEGRHLARRTGTGHRAGWDQGILKLLKAVS